MVQKTIIDIYFTYHEPIVNIIFCIKLLIITKKIKIKNQKKKKKKQKIKKKKRKKEKRKNIYI